MRRKACAPSWKSGRLAGTSLGGVLLLALDSSTPRVTVALVDVAPDASTRVLAEHADDAGNRHGEHLAPAIERMLTAVDAKPGDLTAVACGLGPGPFTGLRVGIVTAASLADALRIPSYGICSLDALAAAHRGAGPLLAVTDARRKQVYWARYDADGHRVQGPDISVPQDITHLPGERVVGVGALQWREAFVGSTIDESDPWPQASMIACLAAERVAAGAPTEQLTPMYLRRPDAQPPGAPKPVTPR